MLHVGLSRKMMCFICSPYQIKTDQFILNMLELVPAQPQGTKGWPFSLLLVICNWKSQISGSLVITSIVGQNQQNQFLPLWSAEFNPMWLLLEDELQSLPSGCNITLARNYLLIHNRI